MKSTTHTPENSSAIKWHNRILYYKASFERSNGNDRQAYGDYCLAAARYESATGKRHHHDPRPMS